MHKVLINGQWQEANSSGTFHAFNPTTTEPLAEQFPVSTWADVEQALDAAATAFIELQKTSPAKIADFLEGFAANIEENSDQIRETAHVETALPLDTRLVGELGRTCGQLRAAATAVRNASWRNPTIDSATNIRSYLSSIGPVAVFGPNNFPLAFGSISGGDFAAAIAAGNPVIAKAHPLHPNTTRLLAEQAHAAVTKAGLPAATVQLIYQLDYADGERMAKDPRLAAIGFTGGRTGGLKLKEVADSVGKPIYLEMSSVNPVVILPAALAERSEAIADEFSTSCLMGVGQFCTNPGLVIMIDSDDSRSFVDQVKTRFEDAGVGTLFSEAGQKSLAGSVAKLVAAGAEVVCGASDGGGSGYSYANTLLQTTGAKFLSDPEAFQTEAFGNASLVVQAKDVAEVVSILQQLEGNLTGCVYSCTSGADDEAYDCVATELRQRVGRLINDKMPTGVAVCSAMNHGGPFPATSSPGFTAVGMPGAIQRFAMLQCFDNVRPERLPELLRDKNPAGAWRCIDGEWTQADAAS